MILGEAYRRMLIRSWARTIFTGIGDNRSKGAPPAESLLTPLPRSLGAARFNIRPGQWFMTKDIEEIGSERGKGDLPVGS